jgi:ATP-binding protein involved in chromosome partitioning
MFNKRKTMTDITKSDLLNTLKKIDEPGFNKDVLILNTIKNLTVKDHSLNVNLFLPIPENAITPQLKSKFESILKKEYSDIKHVELKIEGRAGNTVEAKKDSILPGVKYTIAIAS